MMSDEHRCQNWRTVVRLILSGHYLHPPAAATQYCAGGCVTRDTPCSSPQHLYLTVSSRETKLGK